MESEIDDDNDDDAIENFSLGDKNGGRSKPDDRPSTGFSFKLGQNNLPITKKPSGSSTTKKDSAWLLGSSPTSKS